MKDITLHPSFIKGYIDGCCGEKRSFRSFKQEKSMKIYRYGWAMATVEIIQEEIDNRTDIPELKL